MTSTLLKQIQTDATDHSTPVATVLRRSLILARRLDYAPLGEWARQELEGYGDDAELPDYRAYRSCQVLGDFSGIGGAEMRNQPLPSGVVAEEHRRALFGLELRGGISQYQAIIEADQGASLPWDMNVVAHYQASFYQGWALASARRKLGAGELSQLLETVRTRILNFSLEIETANPDAGETESGQAPIATDAVSSAFHVHVWGNHNVVTTAGRDLSQVQAIDPIRWVELSKVLAGLGVPDEHLDALHDALQEDAGQELPQGAMGPATATWYEKLVDAAKQGAVSLGSDAAGGIIAAELLKFLGAT